ncbi:Two-pore potassium channel 2 [Platanthera zijinensis]|uniref:Two-pore potassium channel 2 n=1 Tax=Platanthera zijinensis TaxID=2320716 RepID=A0AAP0B9I5_9ASPA
MSIEPLLPTTAGADATLSPTRRKSTSSSISCPPLFPLPEHDEVSVPFSPSSLKDRIIFGPYPSSPADQLFGTLNIIPSASSPPSPSPSPSPSSNPLSAEESTTINVDTDGTAERPWPGDPLFSKEARSYFHRCHTAPVMSTVNNLANDQRPHPQSLPDGRQLPIVRNAFILLAGYLVFGVLMYSLNRSDFTASETHPVVDALYFCIVTMCTIGYGDITPASTTSKLFSIAFVLIGFGFIDILLSAMISYVLDVQEHHLLDAAKHRAQGSKLDGAQRSKRDARYYMVDLKKGRMRIRLKVGFALGVVVLCICVGAAFLWLVESLNWLDAFYLSVMSVTTVGYGDRAFKTMGGRLFASAWLLVSTLAVARAFLYLVEARMDKRHREMAKWVLSRDLTVSQFLEADIDNNGFVRSAFLFLPVSLTFIFWRFFFTSSFSSSAC